MPRKSPYGEGPVQWVSTEWLFEHLDEREFMVVDTQPNIHDYISEHIPGAVYLSEGVLRASSHGLPGQYVPAPAIERVFGATGISNEVPVVVYTGTGIYKGWGDGLEQTMMAYSLIRFGHSRVFLLDGGLDKWKEENKPLTKHFPRILPAAFRGTVRDEFIIRYEEFKEIKDSEAVIVADARPRAVYEGQGPWAKPGHIPGAISVPWADFMEQSNRALMKSDDEIKHIINVKKIDPDKSVIVYCGTGREATNELLILKWYLGFPNVRIYEGSFTEWTSYPENPTVVGPYPRLIESPAATYW